MGESFEYQIRCFMKSKKMIRIIIDALMTVVLLLSMGYALWGDFLHEVFGIVLFVLFVVHHIVNLNWYKTIFKGKYSPYRIITLVLNILLTVCIIGLTAGGIMMSKHIFTFMDINSGMSFARRIHLSASYWSFVLISMHIGLHINPMIQKTIRKNKNAKTVLIGVSILISMFGIYAFIKRDFIDYMFLTTQFAFMDFNESPIVFYIEHTAIMGLFISASYSICKCLKSKSKTDKRI